MARLFLILFILAFSSKVVSCGKTAVPFCNTKDDCDPDGDRFTECEGGKCVCIDKTDDSIFLPPSQTCYTKGDKSCVTGGQKCVPNSICVKGLCKCNAGLESNADGLCFIPYGKNCETPKDLCDPMSFLYCGLHMKCECKNPENTTYDLDNPSCRLLTRTPCNDELPKCVQGAECSTASGVCECTSEYEETPERFCITSKLEHGDSCIVGDDQCDTSKYLECNSQSSKCECKGASGKESIFDPNTNQCFLLEGTACGANGQKCAPNSECQNINGEFKCQCEGHMKSNSDGFCFIPFDESCYLANDMCDLYKFLICGIDGKCNCKNPGQSIYEKFDGKCHIIEGAPCTTEGQNCTSNAICDPSRNKCVCDSNYEANISHICVPTTLEFNDTCDSTDDKCNKNRFLSCNSRSICDCAHANSWYDAITQMCYYLAEADCRKYPEQHCISNSYCNNDGECQCNEGLNPNALRFCHVKYHDACNRNSSTDLCDPLQFLECGLFGSCECRNSPHTWYNLASQRCEILSGGKCIPNVSINGSNPNEQECVDKSICTDNGICECISNFVANSSRFCTLTHGEVCGDEPEEKFYCNPESYLTCGSTKRCSCQNYDNAHYDRETNYCYLIEGSLCTPGGQKCDPNSKCLQNGDNFQCTCAEGLVPNENHRCFLPYNSTCTSVNDLCDPDGFLHCNVFQRCTCRDSKLEYYRDSKSCQLLADSECIPNGKEQCAENARCTLSEGKWSCKCSGNFTTDEFGHCRLKHGVQCSEKENLCDEKRFLTCSEHGQCDCQKGHGTYYDAKTQYCYLLAGIHCNASENSQKCVLNSNCDLFSKTCQCNQSTWELEVNAMGHCAIKYEKHCNGENDLCDKSGFLQCDLKDQCGCQRPERTWYNPKTNSCELREGNSCFPGENESQKCFPNSLCVPLGGGGSGEHICKCVEGLTPNQNGLCHLKHGQDCQLDNNDLCDPHAFLSCEPPSLKCACNLLNTIFNQHTQSCERFVGGSCLTDENEPKCIENSHCSLDSKTCACNPEYEYSKNEKSCLKSHGSLCNSSAECNGDNKLDCIGGQCLCKDGHFPYTDDNGEDVTKCLPGHLQSCSLEMTCYPLADLFCTSDGLCQCIRPLEQVFDAEKRKCVGLEGTQCSLDDSREFVNTTDWNCVPNAYCNFNHQVDYYRGVCLCDSGFKPDEEGKCSSKAIVNAVPLASLLSLLFLLSLSINMI